MPRPVVVDPLNEIDVRDQRRVLLDAVKMLSPRARQAVYLRYFEDRSIAETAGILGIPQVSVRVIVHRALAKLRQGLSSRRSDEVAV